MIIGGTTPTLEFGLPFEADMLAASFVTIQQNQTTIFEKPLEACEYEGRTLKAKLTQEETLMLSCDSKAEIRLVVKTLGGDRLETHPIVESVINTSKEGVI